MRRVRRAVTWLVMGITSITVMPTRSAFGQETPSPTTDGAVPPPSRRRSKDPLVATGAIVFAVGYAPAFAVAVPSTAGLFARTVPIVLTLGLACLDGGSGGYLCKGEHGAMQLLVPVVGPILFVGTSPRDSIVNERGRDLETSAKALLYVSAATQAVGLGLLAGGLIRSRPHPSAAKSAADDHPSTPSLDVRPLLTPNTVGLSLGMYRW